MNSRIGWMVLVLVFAGTIGVLEHKKHDREVTQAAAAAEAALPVAGYDFSIYSLDGRVIPFSSFKGKTIFFNFFGTRCGPCLVEMPAVQKMYEKVKEKGIEVVVMSSEDAGTLSNYMAANSFTFPMYQFQPPISVTTVPLDGIPATLIIAPNGKIARVHVGPDAWDSDENVKFILSLAKK